MSKQGRIKELGPERADNSCSEEGIRVLDTKNVAYWKGGSHIEIEAACSACDKTIRHDDFYVRCGPDYKTCGRYCEDCADEHVILCKLAG